MFAAIEKVGQVCVTTLEDIGEFAVFSWLTFRGFLIGLVTPHTWRLLPRQMYTIGVMSVPMVVLTGLFVGMVLGVGSYSNFAAIGLAEKVATVINGAVVRDIGPVLAATMLAGRVGGALTAELGTMKVTEQIDALRVMGADPIRYLAVPRFWACFVLIPFLTAYTDLMGIVGGYLVVVGVYNVGSSEYMHAGFQVEFFDVVTGLVKSVVFGATIGLVSCFKGFRCGQGAEGVGKACTEAFVLSFGLVLGWNLLLAVFSKELFEGLYGPVSIF